MDKPAIPREISPTYYVVELIGAVCLIFDPIQPVGSKGGKGNRRYTVVPMR